MRVRYSFSSRHTKRARNAKKPSKQKGKYPLILAKLIKEADIILEVLDARFIEDTRNEEIEKEIAKKDKKIIYVINKSDLIKKIETKLYPKNVVSCTKRRGIKTLRNRIKSIARKINKEDRIIVGVIGYPNTGKSSLINLLIGRSKAGTGAEAGYTKGLQKLRLTKDITLLDSPGVIPETEYSHIKNQKIAQHVKVGARTYSQVRNPEQIISELVKEFPEILQKHYKIKTESPEHLLEKIGREKNFLKKGNEVNFDKAARFILKEWQVGKIRV